MKKTLLLISTLISTYSFAQKFEEGYFINNSGLKTVCLIKNYDWKNNPKSFEYKTQESDSKVLTNTISDIKEFSINSKSKFVRESVKIDQSSVNDYNLSNNYLPDFKEATVFLKVLVEGKSNLYYYEDQYTEKYFFSVENKIEPLIYKKYMVEKDDISRNVKYGDILQNETFKRQLYTSFKCNDDQSKILKLKYNSDALIAYFLETNNCLTGDNSSTKRVSEVKKFKVNTKINVLLNSQSASINLVYGNLVGKYDFDNKINVGFGFESEAILPYSNGNWSLIFDPNISFYKAEYDIYKPVFANPNYTFKISNTNIRIPLGFRRNIKIDDDSKVFINASFVCNLMNLKYDFDRERPKTNQSITSYGGSFGLGYQLHKMSLELKYFTKSSAYVNDFDQEKYGLKNIALKLGYQIF